MTHTDTDFTARLAAELRRPPAPEEVRFKIQTALGENGGPPARVVAHVDARFVIARLNLLAPGRWRAAHEALPPEMRAPGPGLAYRCRLRVRGALFEDVGTGQDEKSAYSDSLKRAAVRAGVGECLYAIRIPVMRAGEGESELRANQRGRAYLDERNLAALRARYARWLADAGARFGPALPHAPESVVIELPAPEGYPERLARATRAFPGVLPADAIAALAALLGERASAEERPLLEAGRAEELIAVLGRARDAGWSAAGLADIVARALASERTPAERRAAFLAHLEAAASRAA